MASPNVLLFGLGGIGGIYAAILQLSGKCNGFKLISPKFGNHTFKFAGVYKSCQDAAASGQKFSYVLCANKALLDAVPSLSDLLRPVISNSTAIVLLQNGVGAEEPLHESFPTNSIISAVVWTGGRVLPEEDGLAGVEQFNREGLTIGVDYSPKLQKSVEEERLDTLVGMLEAGGGDCIVTQDIQSERWVKVIWNCAWNSLTTVSRLRTNRFLDSSPHALTLSYAVMNEVAAVAKAKGLTIPDGTVEKLIQQCVSVKEGLPSSMLFDCLAKRGMEVEVILGTPLREGQRLGVPVPSLLALYSIVKALDWGNAHPEEAKI
ncbi:hypothetical protein P7C73_g2632, partial [Tremellales sp. Uapishka_1]